MPGNRYFSQDIQNQVHQRAKYLCEYCHTSEKWQYVQFTIDHVIPLNKKGLNSIDNLALACFHCNRRKSNKLTVLDKLSGRQILLFNPRNNQWKDHFIWSKDSLYIMGLTDTGRITIDTLVFNRDRVINIRAADIAVGRHPPSNDPIQS